MSRQPNRFFGLSFEIWERHEFVHRNVLFMSYWAPGLLGWAMDWQLGSAAQNPDLNVLKEMMKKSTARLPERDQSALEGRDLGNVMMDATRERAL
jgi:hypothetical protein